MLEELKSVGIGFSAGTLLAMAATTMFLIAAIRGDWWLAVTATVSLGVAALVMWSNMPKRNSTVSAPRV